MSDQRLDILLVERNLASTRTQAQKMIRAGQVQYQQAGLWKLADKASFKLSATCSIQVIKGDEQRYVSRAGLKLETILKKTKFTMEAWNALDIGQSTGGFTDCLLQHGCGYVVGVDVGHNQLHPTLINHPQVYCLEGVNARYLTQVEIPDHLPNQFNLVVMDVSFISQTLVLPQIPPLLLPQGYLISLVKPQFEVGKDNIGKGGIVKEVRLFKHLEQKICAMLEELGLNVVNYQESIIKGGDGNSEFIVVAQKI